MTATILQARHSSAPWRSAPGRCGGVTLISNDAGPVLMLASPDVNEYDVALVTAAPEMFDACTGLLGLLQMVAHREDVNDALRDVLRTSHRVAEAQAALLKAIGP